MTYRCFGVNKRYLRLKMGDAHLGLYSLLDLKKKLHGFKTREKTARIQWTTILI